MSFLATIPISGAIHVLVSSLLRQHAHIPCATPVVLCLWLFFSQSVCEMRIRSGASMRVWSSRRNAILILCAYVLLGVIYSVVTPLFEAPDEAYHYPYVVRLAKGGGLPRQHPDSLGPWEQEGSQPPLYYAISALLIRWVDTDDLESVRRINPHARIGIPLARDNKNMVVHTPDESFPWHGAALGVHIVRLFSLLLGTGTIWSAYRLSTLVTPRRPHLAVGAMALVAFNPMFVFISASVNNDNLITCLSLVILVLLAERVTGCVRRFHAPLLGLLAGMACLTKLSGLALLPLIGGALALGCWGDGLPTRDLATARAAASGCWQNLRARVSQPGDRSRALLTLGRGVCLWARDFGLVLGVACLVAGWWYARNMMLYGEPLGLSAMLDVFGRRTGSETLESLIAEYRGFRISYWGLFGWMNVLMGPTWLYTLFDLLGIAAIVGLVHHAMRAWRSGEGTRWPIHILLMTWTLAVGVALIRWTSMTHASQGRLIYPAIAAISVGMMLGLSSLVPQRMAKAVAQGLTAALMLLALVVPFVVIAPTYARPPSLTESDIPTSATRFDTSYDGMMRLIAFEIGEAAVSPGGNLPVTLYWQALQSMDEDYSISIHVFGRHGQPLGQRDTYHGRGLYPSSLWAEGEVIRDVFDVPIREDAIGPVAAEIVVGLYRRDDMAVLPARDGNGQLVGKPLLARVKVTGETPQAVPNVTLDADLDHRVHLIGYDLDTSRVRSESVLVLDLHWQVMTPLDGEYSVFVHLVDAAEGMVAQGDGPPMEGQYPTQYWGAGEYLVDRHVAHLPSEMPDGQVRVYVGLYHRETGRRLPVMDAAGELAGDRVLLATLPDLPSSRE